MRSRKHALCMLFTTLFMCEPFSAIACEKGLSQQTECPQKKTIKDKDRTSMEVISEQRKLVGDTYLGVVQAIDNFLSGKNLESHNSDSYLKLELGATQYRDGRTEDGTRLKVRLDLPHSEKRLRLFFDSDLDEEEGVERNIRSVSRGNRIQEDTSTAGIQIRSKDDSSFYFRPSLSLGARYNSGIRSFTRLRFRNKETYVWNWKLGIRQDFWHLGATGWGASNRIQLGKQFSEKFEFNSISDTDYKHYLDQLEFGQRWILSERKSDNFGVDYTLGHIADSSIKAGFTKHFVNVSFLKKVYRDWLYISITPELAYFFDDEEQLDWRTEESITVKFDIFFTEK